MEVALSISVITVITLHLLYVLYIYLFMDRRALWVDRSSLDYCYFIKEEDRVAFYYKNRNGSLFPVKTGSIKISILTALLFALLYPDLPGEARVGKSSKSYAYIRYAEYEDYELYATGNLIWEHSRLVVFIHPYGFRELYDCLSEKVS